MKVKKIYTNSNTDKEINCRVRDTAHSTWPRPRTATASWSFLRFRGHFELYIADCSKLAHPLNKLLSGYSLAANNLKGKHNNHYPNRSEAFNCHTHTHKQTHARAHTQKCSWQNQKKKCSTKDLKFSCVSCFQVHGLEYCPLQDRKTRTTFLREKGFRCS